MYITGFTVCKINVIGVLQDPDPNPTNYSKNIGSTYS